VQVHRVRTRSGERALQTQPYRLADSFDADSLEVARLVATGRPDKALGAYLRPLLPASDRSTLHHLRRRAAFGGDKQSGWGREMGEEVIHQYTETKSVCIGL
jgi:Aldehyde dehydrogenase family